MLTFRQWRIFACFILFLALLIGAFITQTEARTPATSHPVSGRGGAAPLQQDADAAGVYLPLIHKAPPPPTATTPPPPPPALRIDAAARSSYTDSAGNIWAADPGFCDGLSGAYGNISIANTNDPQIYRTEKYRVSSCALTVANGDYTVSLHLMEGYYTGVGRRVLDINVEGVLIDNLDVFAETGGRRRALVKPVDVTVADGELTINFSAEAGEGMIHGIEVLPR